MFPFIIDFIAKQILKKAVSEIGANVLERDVVKKLIQHPLIKRAVSIYLKTKNLKNINISNTVLQKILSKSKNVPELNRTIEHFANIRKVKHQILRKANILVNPSGHIQTRINKSIREVFNEETEVHEINENQAEHAHISSGFLTSSWLDYGIWYPIERIGSSQEKDEEWNGNLTLRVKTGKQRSYTYQEVPWTTWTKMKNADGAGKQFWRLYLRTIVNFAQSKGISSRATSETVKNAKTFQTEVQGYYTTNTSYGKIKGRTTVNKYVLYNKITSSTYNKTKKYKNVHNTQRRKSR